MHVSTWLIIFTHKTLQCIMYVLQLGRDLISLSSRCFSHHWAGCCGDSRCIVFSRVGALCLVVHAPSSSRRSSSDRLCNAQAASIMTGAMSMRVTSSPLSGLNLPFKRPKSCSMMHRALLCKSCSASECWWDGRCLCTVPWPTFKRLLALVIHFYVRNVFSDCMTVQAA